MFSINRKNLFRIIVLFFLSFLLCSSNSGCLGWFKKLCCKEEPPSPEAVITYNNSISNNDDKINEKKITHENLFIIGDVEKCKKVMEKIGTYTCCEQDGVMVYNKEILDDGKRNTFNFYLCGNDVGKCEKIYQNDNQWSSYFFFFVDITDSESLNKLGKILLDFKQKFKNETSRFFLILLKTDPQGGGDIKVDDAEEFCGKNKLNFFGEIDMENNTWGFEDKASFYRAIGEIECYEREKDDYKLGKKMNYDSMSYDVQEKKDIWGMFLCGVKREEIRNVIIYEAIKYQTC